MPTSTWITFTYLGNPVSYLYTGLPSSVFPNAPATTTATPTSTARASSTARTTTTAGRSSNTVSRAASSSSRASAISKTTGGAAGAASSSITRVASSASGTSTSSTSSQTTGGSTAGLGSAATNNGSNHHYRNHVVIPAVVASIVGALLIVALILCCLFFRRRRRNRHTLGAAKSESPSFDDEKSLEKPYVGPTAAPTLPNVEQDPEPLQDRMAGFQNTTGGPVGHSGVSEGLPMLATAVPFMTATSAREINAPARGSTQPQRNYINDPNRSGADSARGAPWAAQPLQHFRRDSPRTNGQPTMSDRQNSAGPSAMAASQSLSPQAGQRSHPSVPTSNYMVTTPTNSDRSITNQTASRNASSMAPVVPIAVGRTAQQPQFRDERQAPSTSQRYPQGVGPAGTASTSGMNTQPDNSRGFSGKGRSYAPNNPTVAHQRRPAELEGANGLPDATGNPGLNPSVSGPGGTFLESPRNSDLPSSLQVGSRSAAAPAPAPAPAPVAGPSTNEAIAAAEGPSNHTRTRSSGLWSGLSDESEQWWGSGVPSSSDGQSSGIMSTGAVGRGTAHIVDGPWHGRLPHDAATGTLGGVTGITPMTQSETTTDDDWTTASQGLGSSTRGSELGLLDVDEDEEAGTPTAETAENTESTVTPTRNTDMGEVSKRLSIPRKPVGTIGVAR